MISTIHMGLVAEVAFKTLLASGVTLGALRLMANRTAAERSFVAHLGLAATLAIPFAALILPYWAINDSLAWLCDIIAPSWLYAIPAVLLGGVTAVAVGRLFGLRNRATVLVEPAWLGALAHAQRRMGFKSGAALLVSPDIASPVSWGLFRPTIVLDERALQAKGEAEAIIAHELAHVARADWAKLLLSRAATALFWFNPLVWLLARQCHELREEAADDAVLRHEVDGSDYAAILVGHARHECRGLLLAANGVAPGKGSLRRRVTRVLDGKLRRAPAGMGFAAAGVLVALTFGTPLAALTLRAPAAPVAPAAPAKPVQPIRVAVDMGDGGHTYATVTPRAPNAPSMVSAVVTDAHGRVISATAPVPARDVEAPAKPRFSAGELIAMSQQGVSPQWLREMAALGYTNLSGGEITALAVQDIDPAYVRGMAQAGYPRLSAGQLIALKVQDVTPDYVRQITRARGPRLSPEQLVALRVQGVNPELVRAAAEARAEAGMARAEAMRAISSMKINVTVSTPVPPKARQAPPKPPAAPANEDD
jgi:bla regulator protein blaR1